MKKHISKRIISATLAFVMVFLMIPISSMTIHAEGTETYAGDGEYIGKSYNVLGNAPFEEDSLTLSEVFTDRKSLEFEIRPKNETECTYSLVDDFNSYSYEQSKSLDASIDVSAKIKIVQLSASAKYGMSSSSSSSGEKHSEYFVMDVTHVENTMYMNVTPTTLRKMWDDGVVAKEFISNINVLESADLFAMYGTHIITGYSTGGYSYAAYEGESIATNASFADSRNTSVSLGIDVSSFVNLKGDMNITENNSGSTSSGSNNVLSGRDTVGGNGNILDLSKDGVNTADVNNFIDSITKENSRIIVDDNLKMLSVWDFIYASGDKSLYNAAQALEEYYYEHIDGEKEQIGGYSNDFLDYADCQIITTPEELYNVRNDLDSVYVLACNIDLSAYENWEPIGSKLNPFTGRFYGNSNTISGLSITSCTDNIAGLFGYNNGTIQGVRVKGNIAVDSASSVGAVAAYNNGIITDCYDAVVYDVDYFNLTDANLGLRKINLETVSAQTITIGDENGIHLVGQPDKTYTGINIVVADNDVESPAYIVLENVNFVGDSANGSIYSNNDRPIYIVSIGTANMISGANSKSAINAAITNVTFFGNAELSVKGGNGTGGAKGDDKSASSRTNAGNGSAGTNGAVAILCKSLNVNAMGAITVVGGDGGNGGNGGNVTGTHNAGDHPKLASGGDGGNGGNAGAPVELQILNIVSEASVLLQYGNGGNAGHGGCGGSTSPDGNDDPDSGGNGGHGGNGGNGFVSGIGGNGGAGGASYGNYDWLQTKKGTSGRGGNAGKSGDAIASVLIKDKKIERQEGTISKSGNPGAAGSTSGGEKEAYSGGSGDTAALGITDNSFYDESVNLIILHDNSIEKRMLIGILSGYSNSTNLSTINRSAWNKVNLSIGSVSKTNYFSGDEFDKSTISVSSKGEDVYYDYSFNSQRIGINYVKVTDGTCTRLIPVYVTETMPMSIEIVEPGKVEFVKNTEFVVEGLKIKAIYNNGSEAYFDENSEGITWTNPSVASEGNKTVTVSYDYDSDASTPALQATYTINVVRVSVTHIEVENDPNDLEYAPNEEFNPNGLKIKIFKNDGSTEEIDATSNDLIYVYDFSVAGSRTVTVDYNGHKAYIVCTVTAHAFGDWYTVEEADHNQEGLERRDCSYATSGHYNCFETQVIPTVAHTFDKEITNDDYKKSDATLESPAIYYYSCECGAKGDQTFSYGNPIEDIMSPRIIIDSKNAVIGSYVTININLQNNPGITSMKINVAYDSALLTLYDVEYNSAMGGQSVLPEKMTTLNGNVILYWTDGFVNYSEDGVFATLTFIVNEDAVPGATTTISASYDPEDVYNADETNVTFYCEDGVITFTDYTPGDINGDGVVNTKDTTRLMRYLAGWEVEVNEAALDVNGDGSVNTKDTTRLMRYLAGWDVEVY